MRFSKLVVWVFFLAGLALLCGMVWQVGITGLLTIFQAVGLWIAPWILLDSIPTVLHTAGWAACFQSRRSPIRFWHLLLIRLAGSAINHVTPTATIGGEVVKVLLLEPVLPREQAMASVIIGKASFTLAQVLYLMLGVLYLTQRLSIPVELQLSLRFTIGMIALGLIGFIAFQRYGLLSKLVHGLERCNIGRARLQRLHQHLLPLEAYLAVYYTSHLWRFVGSLLLHFLGFAFVSVKTFLLLRLLLSSNAPSFAEAVTATVVIAALDQVFFFVPGGLGTFEGIRFTVLSTLGIAQVYGLAFGLIARLESLFWNGLGLLAYALCTRTALFPSAVRPVASSPPALPPTTP
jgi:glycosyltransferase 2 family protein